MQPSNGASYGYNSNSTVATLITALDRVNREIRTRSKLASQLGQTTTKVWYTDPRLARVRSMNGRRALIAIGGFPGTGKSCISRRLANELSLPRLDSDTIGRTIRRSLGDRFSSDDAFRAGYDVLFELSREFLTGNCSVIVDLSLGWPFQWRELDKVWSGASGAILVPIVLRCAKEVCVERIQQRHLGNPELYPPAEDFMRQPQLPEIWDFLSGLNRPDVRFVDATPALDRVHADVLAQVEAVLGTRAQ